MVEYQLLHSRNGPDYRRFKPFRETGRNGANEMQPHKAGRACVKVESIIRLSGDLIGRIAENTEERAQLDHNPSQLQRDFLVSRGSNGLCPQ